MKYYVISSSLPSKGESGESVGSQYNLDSACKNCGTGARLVGPLRTKGLKRVADYWLYTLDGDLLISNDLKTNLVNMGVRLLETRDVVATDGTRLPYYLILPLLSFPRRLAQSKGLRVEDQCPVCKQNGFFNDVKIGDLSKGIPTYVKPLEFHYENIDKRLVERSDIFHTWEHMGLSNLRAEGNKIVRYARPLLLVSENFKVAIEGLKVNKILFEEVFLH